MKYLVNILVCLFIFSTHTWAQTATNPPDKSLTRIIAKNSRVPRKMEEESISAFFSLKFVFSDNNRLDTVLASKYTPPEMVLSLCDMKKYINVKWDSLFKKSFRKGNLILLPIAIYSTDAQQTTFSEYTLDDLYNFSGDTGVLLNCTVMQPIVIKYGPILR